MDTVMMVTYTPAEVAELLHTSDRWVRDNVRAGKFPHLRVGKGRIVITADQLAQIVTICTPQPTQPKPVRLLGTRATRRTN